MSAMTMPFRAKQRELLDGLRVGDLVRALKIYNGTDWTPQQLIHDLETIAAG